MKTIFALSIVLFVLYSCKKNDNKPASKEGLLTSGSWIVIAVVTDDDGDGSYEIDEYADFEPCYKDNIWNFKTGGILELDEGATKCDPADPQVTTSDWQFTNNETGLIVARDSYIIDQLDANQMVLRLAYGTSRSSKVTFSKQ